MDSSGLSSVMKGAGGCMVGCEFTLLICIVDHYSELLLQPNHMASVTKSKGWYLEQHLIQEGKHLQSLY